MLTILDLNAELAKLKMLRGRTPETPPEAREGSFARLAPYRDSAINVAKFSGEGPWERHVNGDEIVQVVDGATTFHIMFDEGPQTFALKAGTVVIVPQGKLAPLRGAGRRDADDDDAAADPAPDFRDRRPAHPRLIAPRRPRNGVAARPVSAWNLQAPHFSLSRPDPFGRRFRL